MDILDLLYLIVVLATFGVLSFAVAAAAVAVMFFLFMFVMIWWSRGGGGGSSGRSMVDGCGTGGALVAWRGWRSRLWRQ